VKNLLRWLGLDLAARVGTMLPAPLGTLVGATVLVVANLVPIWGVLSGQLGMGDVFLVYWFENVVIGCTTVVKIRTAGDGTQAGDKPAFFALHYGIFTLVHGIFSVALAALTGIHGGMLNLLLTCLAILVGQVLNLGLTWFGADERSVTTPGAAMFAPYPRMFVLHGSVIASFLLAGGPDGQLDNQVGAVALLCTGKALVDLGFFVAGRLLVARGSGRHARQAGVPLTSPGPQQSGT
jgi:hypothetical protein